MVTLSESQRRERESLTNLVARLRPSLHDDEYVAILTEIVSRHLASDTGFVFAFFFLFWTIVWCRDLVRGFGGRVEVEAVVVQTMETTGMVPTLVAMLEARPSENVQAHLLHVLTNALSTCTTPNTHTHTHRTKREREREREVFEVERTPELIEFFFRIESGWRAGMVRAAVSGREQARLCWTSTR